MQLYLILSCETAGMNLTRNIEILIWVIIHAPAALSSFRTTGMYSGVKHCVFLV